MVDVHDGVNKLHEKLRSLMKTLVEQKDSIEQFKDIKLYSFVSSVIEDVKAFLQQPRSGFQY